MSQTEGGYFFTNLGSDRLSFPSFYIYIIPYFQLLSSSNKLLFPPFYAKIFTRETLDVRRSIHLPKVRCTLKGGEAVYITLSDLTQIGIFLTAFTVMIFTIISFFINKKK